MKTLLREWRLPDPDRSVSGGKNAVICPTGKQAIDLERPIVTRLRSLKYMQIYLRRNQ
jgi:hypothetical protein